MPMSMRACGRVGVQAWERAHICTRAWGVIRRVAATCGLAVSVKTDPSDSPRYRGRLMAPLHCVNKCCMPPSHSLLEDGAQGIVFYGCVNIGHILQYPQKRLRTGPAVAEGQCFVSRDMSPISQGAFLPVLQGLPMPVSRRSTSAVIQIRQAPSPVPCSGSYLHCVPGLSVLE